MGTGHSTLYNIHNGIKNSRDYVCHVDTFIFIYCFAPVFSTCAFYNSWGSMYIANNGPD